MVRLVLFTVLGLKLWQRITGLQERGQPCKSRQGQACECQIWSIPMAWMVGRDSTSQGISGSDSHSIMNCVLAACRCEGLAGGGALR